MYGLETYNRNRVVPYCSSIKKLSKISGKHHRDTTEKQNQKSLNDCVVFEGSDCNNETLDRV